MENEKNIACLNCGKIISMDDNVCRFCGTPTEKGKNQVLSHPQSTIPPQTYINKQTMPTKEKRKLPKWPIFIGVGVVVVVVVLNLICFHSEWTTATCEAPETCVKCGKTRGEKLEHIWTEATCEIPKTCNLCNVTDGKAIGHNVKEWKNVASSTCTIKGKDEGFCIICNETVVRELDLLQHTEGEWEITKMPTANSKGERSLKCTICNEVLKTEAYELSPEELEAEYKANCQKYSYNTIARSPGEYKNKYARFYGKVIQVMQSKANGKINYTLRIGTGGSYYYDNVIIASYTADESEPRILEDDMVTVYGKLGGEYTYETVMGNEITLPLMYIEYVD